MDAANRVMGNNGPKIRFAVLATAPAMLCENSALSSDTPRTARQVRVYARKNA